MLFDLGTGRKKRVVQAVYALLALLFLVGFVGFGVGSEVGQGGLADIFTGGSDSVEETQFAEDADEIEKDLEDDPRNEVLMVELISTRYSAGNALTDVDEETGAPIVTPEAKEQYEKAAEAWQRYLALKPEKPNSSAATFAVQSLTLLAQNAATENEADASYAEAADAQAVIVKQRPSVGTLSQLAFYSYAALDFKRGDAAAKRAASLAQGKGARKRIARQLDGYRTQAKLYAAQRKREQQAGNQGDEPGSDNPLSDITGGADPLGPAP